MKAQITGIVAGVIVKEKTWNNEVQKDKQGRPIIERKLMILDSEDTENFDPIKINFDEDQEEVCKTLHREEVTANLIVCKYGKHTYFRLHSVQGL